MNCRDIFTIGPRTVTLEVVGVVANLKLHGSVDSAREIGAYFVPFHKRTIAGRLLQNAT